ncbi:uncharacterized protein RCC_08338 [Ramularia collo-cygni]|uniref:Uncharacterized protein n=1 Tax=Ramularia collo-cygni TaxID=112498 RepID=A0A2D3V3T8_9PEZI|nr:uncharacterized protein RCC_08338 [Ramularia collo-cygni]CZT22633.1 uncharacterized protein RCC_08338 [Ramularia collo-cygni]
MTDQLQQTQESLSTASDQASEKWNVMSEEQKKQTFDALPEEQKKGKTSYVEWIQEGYHNQYRNWMPWIEDQYLKWFTKDNKTSYAAKDTLDKSKITGVSQIDNVQDGVHSTVSGTMGQGGLLQPVGDAVSKEGINRAERGEDVGYTQSMTDGVKGAGEGIVGGVKGAGGYVGGMFGGKEEAK